VYKQFMQLAEFMQAKSLSDEDVAAMIRRNRASVSRYRRGLETPSPGIIKKLVEISGGLVTANELLGIEQAAE
jgi:predicted transcriptional regulator